MVAEPGLCVREVEHRAGPGPGVGEAPVPHAVVEHAVLPAAQARRDGGAVAVGPLGLRVRRELGGAVLRSDVHQRHEDVEAVRGQWGVVVPQGAAVLRRRMRPFGEGRGGS